MKKDKAPSKDHAGRRHRAEERVARKTSRPSPPASEEDARRLLHELQVHQLELQRQNEELLQARQGLEASLERYTDLYDFAPVGYLTLDDQGVIAESNHTGARLLGVDRSKLLGQPFDAWIDLESRSAWRQFLGALSLGTEKKTCQVKLGRNAAIPRFLHLEGAATEPCLGQPWQCRVVVVDISERRRAEVALAESEARFRTLVENIPQKVFLKDADSVYVSCNPSYARDLGIRPEEIRGRTDLDFYAAPLAEKYRADDRRIMASGQPEHLTENYVLDGKQRWVSTVKTPVTDQKGRVTGILGVFWDITESKQAEEDLRHSEQALRNLVRANPESLLLIDSHGIVLAINQTAASRLGRGVDDILGHDIFGVMPAELVDIRRMRVQEALQSGRPVRYKDQRHGRHLDNYISPIADAQGQVGWLAIFAVDITDMVQAQEQLTQARDELEARVRERTRELREEVSQRQLAQEALMRHSGLLEEMVTQRTLELEQKTEALASHATKLEDLNAALRVLLEQRQTDQRDIENRLCSNLSSLVAFHLEELSTLGLSPRQAASLEAALGNLRELGRNFSSTVFSRFNGLTPREIQVAQMVREGHSSKDIAGLLALSVRSVDFHRRNIRQKLGVGPKGVNLRSHLLKLK